MARIITITSGKGGAGKTNISLNLALALSSRGSRVCLFDADLGLANLNILTGIHPKENLEAVINGRRTLNEILIRNYQGIDIIPGSTGVAKLADISSREAETLIESFLNLPNYDYFIFDTSAGISSQVLSFCMASGEIILVITPEPTSLTDAYSLLKILSQNGYDRPVRALVNQVKNPKTARNAYGQLKDTVTRFLSLDLLPLGMMVEDRHVPMSVISQTPFYLVFPESKAAACIQSIADKLTCDEWNDTGMASFWKNCISFLTARKKIQPGKSFTDNSFTENLIPGQSFTEKSLPEKISIKDKNREADLITVIQGMEQKISFLVDEIKTLKAMIRPLETENPGSNLPHGVLEKTGNPEKFILNFEAWMAGKSGTSSSVQ